MYLDTEYFNS